MMEQNEEWRNHNEEEWISYKWDQTMYYHELWRIEEHIWCACARKVDMKKVDKLWIIPP
jgi:hypothetical protein